jgi:hypothetical protein
MGEMSEHFKNSRWTPFIYHLDDIQEESPYMCVWNATILVLIFLIICPNLFARYVSDIPKKRSMSE